MAVRGRDRESRRLATSARLPTAITLAEVGTPEVHDEIDRRNFYIG